MLQCTSMSDQNLTMEEAVGEEQPGQEGSEFHTGQVAAIAGAHFTHDIYSSFVAPLLPLLRDNLFLSYTQAGSLVIVSQLASLLNPFIGYIADRVSVRYFVIFAPAVSATLFSVMGLAPDYLVLMILLFAAGISIAAFHAPAPAMMARVSGDKVGRGMSIFMAGGELARAVGPLFVVAGVGWFGLDGIWRLAFVGWAVSIILYFALKSTPAQTHHPGMSDLATFWPQARRVFPAMMWLLAGRVFMLSALTTYLAIYISDIRMGSLWLAASSLTILEIAGFAGALTTGTISDRFGRNNVLLALLISSPILFLVFIFGPIWLALPVLILIGFTAISPQPVLLALIQDQFPGHRALGNGTYLALNFLIRAVGIYFVGLFADRLGLDNAFMVAALLAFISIPAVFFLPKRGQPITSL